MTRLGFHCHGLDHFDKVILSNGLKRGEFYNFVPQSLPDLRKEIRRHNLASSVHAPLTRIPWYPTPPTLSFLCDIDPEKRQLSLRMVQETMELAEDFGADYVVVHYPVPPSREVSGVGNDELIEICWQSACSLSELSLRHGVPIHIEGFGPSPFLTTDFIVEVTSKLEGLLYCFDIGHMNIAARRDGFDLYRFAQRLAPYIGSVHMWNNRGIRDYFSFGHIPLHPCQKPEDGWVDIDRILRLIVPNNPACCLILESSSSYPEALGGHDFRDGVKWVKDLIAALS